MARHIATASLLAGLLVVSSAAVAQQAGDPRFVPITIRPTGPESSVVVARGDHLWKISSAHLETIFGRRPTVSEIAPYWLVVIANNQPNLRSGDPDLIYPGEIVILPERPTERA